MHSAAATLKVTLIERLLAHEDINISLENAVGERPYEIAYNQLADESILKLLRIS